MSHDHEAYPVARAAATAGLSVRHLHRLCVAHLGCPPGTVIDLARARSLSVEISTESGTLSAIARRHGFGRQSDMNRFFCRFIGTGPRVFRAGVKQHASRSTGQSE
jgi:AraC-like DNA-binding protein